MNDFKSWRTLSVCFQILVYLGKSALPLCSDGQDMFDMGICTRTVSKRIILQHWDGTWILVSLVPRLIRHFSEILNPG